MNSQKLLIFANKVGQRKDLVLAFLLIGIVFMMILPMPTALVDVLIAINIGISIIMLMLAVYISSPLEFSVFPAMLLLTTLFRLALSITTTRLILLQADAGQIVTAFGNFVVGGNLVVGIVVFLIITIVQFMVITKGSERVAEVSARFSLDAMPGKQMSIDGDMRAGVIDMDEAAARRATVEKESQLYGSMDGAMKFVKGDAIAGLIIIVVNILGGISIGVAQNGMSAGEALELYTILTVGDGLISQIPALLISITAGFIVTRVTQDDSQDLGNDIGGQIISKPKALMIGAVIMLFFSMIPGFPTLTFMGLSALFGTLGWWLSKVNIDEMFPDNNSNQAMVPAGQKPKPKSKDLTAQEEFLLTMPLLIDVAANTEGALDKTELNENLLKVRRALYLDLGVPFPGMHLRFNQGMADNQYTIMLHEVPIASAELKPGHLLVVGQGKQLDMLGIDYQTDDKILKPQLAFWVHESHYEALEGIGLSYMKTTQIVTYHLSQVLKRYAEEFIGIQETRYLLEKMEADFGELVREAQRIVPLQKITEILQRLVSEDISIRNLRMIMESIVEWGPKEKDLVTLVEYIRSNLKRQISYKYSNGQNVLPVYLLEAELEETIRGAIRQTSSGAYLALDPNTTNQFVHAVKKQVGNVEQMSTRPVLLASMDIRRYIRKLLELELYDLSILSHQDLTSEITIQPLGRINL